MALSASMLQAAASSFDDEQVVVLDTHAADSSDEADGWVMLPACEVHPLGRVEVQRYFHKGRPEAFWTQNGKVEDV